MANANTQDSTDAVVWDSNEGEIDPAAFDAWDEAAEEAALEQAAAAVDVKHIVIEGRTFAGRFPDGTIIQAPLVFSVADLEAVTAETDNPVDQVKALLRRLGDDDGAEQLQNQNLTSVVIFAEKFFTTFSRVTEVALGKSSRS